MVDTANKLAKFQGDATDGLMLAGASARAVNAYHTHLLACKN